jgi:hypothetical protein
MASNGEERQKFGALFPMKDASGVRTGPQGPAVFLLIADEPSDLRGAGLRQQLFAMLRAE